MIIDSALIASYLEVIARAFGGLWILRDDYLVLCWLSHVEKTTPED